MKAFPWLLFLAFEAMSLTCSFAAGLTELVYRDQFRISGFPAWTQALLVSKDWLPAFPLPWLVHSAVLSCRREVSVSSLLNYTGTICLGCSLFLCWVIAGLLLPYYATHILVSVRTVTGR